MIAFSARPLDHAARTAAAFLWPQRCPGCGADSPARGLLCAACDARLQRLALPLCTRCLEAGADPLCTRHATHRVWPAWSYDDRAALVVEALKFGARTDLAFALGVELARAVPAAPAPALVVAVPLHAARERERGYNQSELLAAALADALGVPHLSGALVRDRATRPQTRLGPDARRANVRGAFRVRHPHRLAGRAVLVVDDVVTTGATMAACLDALTGAGAAATGVTLAWAH